MRRRMPQLMMSGERMEQNDRRAVAKEFVDDFGIAASDLVHHAIGKELTHASSRAL